ncbi:MAG: transposase [Candidatus Paceibacterota bacterium]|jgi:transposase-like protein
MKHRTTSRRGGFNTAEELSNYLLSALGDNLKQAVKSCVEVCVRSEMEGIRNREAEKHLVFNGSYDRNLVSNIGKVPVDIPRFRTGNGDHDIRALSVFETARGSFEDLIAHMHLAGISQRKIDKLGKLLFGKAVPPQTTRRLHEALSEEEAFKVNDRSLAGESFDYLYADGIWFSSLGSLTKRKKDRVALAVYGWSKERQQGTFLGFRLAGGESADEWKELIASIHKRGFDIKSAKLISADDGQGLLSALEDMAPSMPVQICIAHRYRNVLAHTRHVNKRAVADDLKKLTACSSKEEAVAHLKDMEKRWQVNEPRAVTSLLFNVNRSLTYFDFPKEDWKMIRTSNKVERSFREIRRRTAVSDHHFQSDASAEKYIASAIGWRNLTV